MARKAKVPNHIKKRLKRKEGKRRVGVLPKRQYILIVCEGYKTEPNYFEAFKNDLPKGVLDSVIIDIDGTGKNTISLIDETIKYRDKREKDLSRQYDQTWAVFDRDSFPVENFNNAIFKARDTRPEIFCAWSNEAFELWYLLHFDFYQSAFSRHQYQELLEKAINKKLGESFKYKKNDPDLYQILNNHGDVDKAIDRAIALEEMHHGENFSVHNPCTLVYKLIVELLKFKPM